MTQPYGFYVLQLYQLSDEPTSILGLYWDLELVFLSLISDFLFETYVLAFILLKVGSLPNFSQSDLVRE